MQSVITYKPKIDYARLAKAGAQAIPERREIKPPPDYSDVPELVMLIVQAVGAELRIPYGKIMSRSRRFSIREARQIAQYIARKHSGMSFNEIVHAFGQTCHTAALNANRRVKGFIETDERVRGVVGRVEARLGFTEAA
jgi:hypothetical protein